MSDQEFLLYPLDTGEDPVCLGCGSQMTVAGHEVRESKPDFITFRCPSADGRRSFCWKNSSRSPEGISENPQLRSTAIARHH
jgi:hypothetical protein